jgi:hypothetical protein
LPKIFGRGSTWQFFQRDGRRRTIYFSRTAAGKLHNKKRGIFVLFTEESNNWHPDGEKLNVGNE